MMKMIIAAIINAIIGTTILIISVISISDPIMPITVGNAVAQLFKYKSTQAWFQKFAITVQHASLLMNENNGNEIINYYVDETSSISKLCGTDSRYPCRQIDDVFKFLVTNDQYIIHVSEGQYDHDLFIYNYFKDFVYPTVDIVAEGNALINIIGPIQSIGEIILSFSKFNIDFGDLFFQIDDSDSSLKLANCIIFRNSGNKAINTQQLAVVNHGSLILENLIINGNNLQGNQPLIQAASPKLILFTTLNIINISLVSGNTSPLLLSANELEQESNIMIYDVHVKQNTAGTQAQAGIIFVHIKDQAINSKNNEDPSIEPILVIENLEIVLNSLAPISEACSIQLEGLKPLQIIIRSSTINNRSPPNNNKQYEFKIILPQYSYQQDLITQFSQVDFGATFDPIAVKVLPNDQFQKLAILTEQYANI
ncbi:MAG: hypothetical protein EZS28_029536 [Streblomastix strix]|uniref:Transmembrane protein n=1 Tax=Streblomastix strix TaxID=222440 RepID=A0A5J4UWW5_9EUKA|nr:MAG: hypothetical protein EZS28_029536 [Streblomastix strix]